MGRRKDHHAGALQDQIRPCRSRSRRNWGVWPGDAERARASAEQAGKPLASLGDRLPNSLQQRQAWQVETLDDVAAVGSRVQAVFGDWNTMRQALNDLTAAMAKLSPQVSDLGATVKIGSGDQAGRSRPGARRRNFRLCLVSQSKVTA
jgi:hypothetical protein